MSVAGWLKYEQDYFGGQWTAPDRATVDKRGALLAQNVRFFGKQVGTRYGWGVGISFSSPPANTTGILGPMYNWISSLGNYLAWADINNPPNYIYLTKVSDNPPTITQVTVPANFNTPVFAAVGPRLYVANWIASGSNVAFTTAGPGVITNNGSFNYDSIIPGPPSTAATGSGVQIPLTAPTEPGGGVVTAGLHTLGLRMLHRSGFLGRPGPDSSTSANPTSVTYAPIQFTSSGSKNLQWAFTPGGNWPADVIQVQAVMSPVSNKNRLFLVPGAVQNVTGGAATPVTFTINIDDDSLIAGAAQNECTNALQFYTASATGQAYMQCIAVACIGSRMFYVSQLPDANGNMYSVVFASDPGQHQQISLSQHFLQLPNQLAIRSVFAVNGAIYLSGPHWTYLTQDTGGVPVTWPTPQIVDGRKGTEAPNCIEVATSGKYGWLGDKTGLYYFDGSFGELPISYLGTEWASSVFFPDAQVQIKDDPLRHRVIVNCAQGFMLIWDYTKGMTPYTVRPYRQDKSGGAGIGGFSGGGIEIVQNDLFGSASAGFKAPELWVGASSLFSGTLFIFREKNPAFDTNIYRDDGSGGSAGIHAIYEPNIFPADGPYSVGTADFLAHQAAMVRMVGNKTILPKVFSFDKTQSINLPSVNLDTLTEGKAFLGGYLISQGGYIYHFEQNVLDGNFTLTDITSYYTHYASHQ